MVKKYKYYNGGKGSTKWVMFLGVCSCICLYCKFMFYYIYSIFLILCVDWQGYAWFGEWKKIFQLKMQYLFLAFVFTNNTILIRISFCRKRLKIGPVVATMSIWCPYRRLVKCVIGWQWYHTHQRIKMYSNIKSYSKRSTTTSKFQI